MEGNRLLTVLFLQLHTGNQYFKTVVNIVAIPLFLLFLS